MPSCSGVCQDNTIPLQLLACRLRMKRPSEVDGTCSPTLILIAHSLFCTFIIGDVVVSYNKASNTKFDFRVNVEDLSVECNLKWRYKWSFTTVDPAESR